MIFGIGTDVVEVSRIEAIVARYGSRFACRVLSEHELVECNRNAHLPHFLAKRFAVKEAFSKAVGTGLREPVSLKRITVNHDSQGKPILQFDAVLGDYLRQLGIRATHLSISDERSVVIAFVILEVI